MEKQFLKRKLSDLIIIEGFWNIGKTSFLNHLAKLNDFEKIEEPNHLKENIKVNISSWYKKQHQKRMKASSSFLKQGKRVVMERSLISNVSYKYACGRKLLKEDFDILREIGLLESNLSVVFFCASEGFVRRQSKKIVDNDTRELLSKNSFYKKYLEFYKKILPRFLKSVIIIKVDNNGFFEKNDLMLKKFYNFFPLLEKERVECASIVPFYKDKILLLYDYKYNHYVLPQGHREHGENLERTAIREMREETGFNKLRLVRKIKKYQYHYYTKEKIIYKKIHVFLVEILNIKKGKKKLEKHEKYSNKFFSITEAIDRVKWLQDKEGIFLSKEIIKNPRPLRSED